MRFVSRKILGILTLVGFCAGCVTPAHANAPDWVRVADRQPVKQAIPFAADAVGRNSLLKTVKIGIRANTKVGDLHNGWFCAKNAGDVLWTEKVSESFKESFPAVYQEELRSAHYPVTAMADTIFDEAVDSANSGRELQVGALIKDAKVDLCAESGVKGAAYLRIFWQVYAPEVQKVVFETTTEGWFKTERGQAAPEVFFEKAFAANVGGLLAEPGFHDLIAKGKMAEAKAPRWLDILKLKGGKANGEALTKNIGNLRAVVVTIVRDDGASGSGFFISQDGYLLTNKHVVGNAKFVKVKLPTGMDLVGEVVRVEAERDVALVKTPISGVQAMPWRAGDLKIGEDVYVLGSPLGDQFSTTLTHGIMSAYRMLDDKRFVQSDVAILPGTSGGPLLDVKGQVVGITVMGLGAKGLAGMNFFIPITEALERLGVQLTD
jgi:serine protease Do